MSNTLEDQQINLKHRLSQKKVNRMTESADINTNKRANRNIRNILSKSVSKYNDNLK